MKISVANARALATALTAAADAADKNGETECEVLSAAQAVDDAARDELAKAIAQAKAGGG
jgi:hypothetical protein